jgi:hypothetical protein
MQKKLLRRSRKNIRSTPVSPPPSLAQDQVWQVDGRYVRIVAIGKRLVQYKLAYGVRARSPKALPVRIAKVEEVKSYLKTNHGTLLLSRQTPS